MEREVEGEGERVRETREKEGVSLTAHATPTLVNPP